MCFGKDAAGCPSIHLIFSLICTFIVSAEAYPNVHRLKGGTLVNLSSVYSNLNYVHRTLAAGYTSVNCFASLLRLG